MKLICKVLSFTQTRIKLCKNEINIKTSIKNFVTDV